MTSMSQNGPCNAKGHPPTCRCGFGGTGPSAEADLGGLGLGMGPDADPFTAPLDRVLAVQAWGIESHLAQMGPLSDPYALPMSDGGRWEVTLTDWSPENTAQCGIVESGQYNALRYDAEGNQTPDFSLSGFERLGDRRQAAAHTADFLVRCQRADQAKAAEQAWHAEADADANSIGARLGASMTSSLMRQVAPVARECSSCDSPGAPGSCPECGGAGTYDAGTETAFKCRDCNGKGWEWDTEGQIDCSGCDGAGLAPGTPAGRDQVNARWHGTFHRRRDGVYPLSPYAMRFEANRPITDAEMHQMAQLIGYGYRAAVRGEPMELPVRDSDRSFIVSADTTKSASDDLGVALDDFEQSLPGLLQDGSPVRTTNRAGAGTAGTRLVDGLGDAPAIAIYYDDVFSD